MTKVDVTPTNYEKAVSSILSACTTYKEKHNMRHGSIEDDILDSLVAVNKMYEDNHAQAKDLSNAGKSRQLNEDMRLDAEKKIQRTLS